MQKVTLIAQPNPTATNNSSRCSEVTADTTHSEKPNRRNFRVWSGVVVDSVVTWPWLFQTDHFWRFGSAAICSTIGLLSDSYAFQFSPTWYIHKGWWSRCDLDPVTDTACLRLPSKSSLLHLLTMSIYLRLPQDPYSKTRWGNNSRHFSYSCWIEKKNVRKLVYVLVLAAISVYLELTCVSVIRLSP